MADDSKELRIGIAIEATGDGAQQTRDEIQGVSEATTDLKEKVDGIGEANPEIKVDASQVEEATETATDLGQAVEAVGEVEAAPVVDATSVEEATEKTAEVTEALDTLSEKETVIQVDSSSLEEASENAEEATDDIAESGIALEDALGSGSNVSTISSGLIDLSKELKGVGKLLKSVGLNAGGASGLIGKCSIAVKGLTLAFRANPILATAAALGTLISVFGYFKSKAEEAAAAQKDVTKTAEEAAAAELELAKNAGYSADAQARLKTATDSAETAIASQNARLAESKRLMDLSINAIERRTEAQAKMTDAMTANQILDVDLLELNGGISKEDADTQRAAIRQAAEDAKFAGDQNAKRAVLEKLKAAQDDIVNQIRQKKEELAAAEANLNKSGPSADAVGVMERAKAQMEDAQKMLEAARDRGPQLAVGGMGGQVAASQEAVQASILLEDSKQKIAEAQARINRETKEGNINLKKDYDDQKKSLDDLLKRETEIRDSYDNKVPALQEQIELDKKLKDQADERLAKETEIAQVKDRQAQAAKDQADEADRLKASASVKATPSTATPRKSSTEPATPKSEAPLERVTPEGRINARPTHVTGTVTGAIDQPIDINKPAQGGTNFQEELRQRHGQPAAQGGQQGGGNASGAGKEAADAAKGLADEVAGLKELTSTLQGATKEVSAFRGSFTTAMSSHAAEIKQLRADVDRISRV